MAKVQSSKDARFYGDPKIIFGKLYFFLGFKYIKAPQNDLP